MVCFRCLFFLGLALLVLPVPVVAQEQASDGYIVKFNEKNVASFTQRLRSLSLSALDLNQASVKNMLARSAGGASTEDLPFALTLFKESSTASVSKEELEQLKQAGLIEYYEPNAKLQAFATPKDTLYDLGFMWGLHNEGAFGGTPDVDIDAPEAWDISTGDETAVVAVIDTGVLHTHPDLEPNRWVNPGEIPGNGIDDDGNGFVDDIHGYDFVNNDGDPTDDMFHGTHVAGTIGAVGNNQRGVTGINWKVKLMGLKMLDFQGAGNTDDGIKAIDYAIKAKQKYNLNLKVINASWGSYDFSQGLKDAIAAANTAGILFVAAAGNGGDDATSDDNDTLAIYPANYDLPNVISVAAIDRSGNLTAFSNYGLNTVHLAAPGKGIWSTMIFDLYFFSDGTSMAAPHVAGVAALAYSVHPSFNPTQMRQLLMDTAKPLASLQGLMVSPGVVNAFNAITGDSTASNEPPPEVPATPSGLFAAQGISASTVNVSWNAVQGANLYKVYRSQFAGSRGELVATVNSTSLSDASAIPGVRYYYTAVAVNRGGDSAESNTAEGWRGSTTSVVDSDGDGFTDVDESSQGTNPRDPGSVPFTLKSPGTVFTKYNTFLTHADGSMAQWNILELGSVGTDVLNVSITVYTINGAVKSRFALAINPGQQVDVLVHDLVGEANTFGLIRIDYNAAGGGDAVLSGRMSNYRVDPGGGSFSFAYAREFQNPIQGRSYATGNSIDPQNQGFMVASWAEIMNLDSVARNFTFNLYSQEGRLVFSEAVNVPPLGERDLAAGHQFGQGVYLAEFVPHDGATKYLAAVTRYSSNAPAGTVPDTYNFAFTIAARAGNGEQQLIPITKRTGSCWTQTNWVEVANVRSEVMQGTLVFRHRNGGVISSTPISLAPKAQQHFNASALMRDGDTGSAEIVGNDAGSFIAQALVYFHDCQDNKMQSAYASISQQLIPGSRKGTFNTNVGMRNILTIMSNQGYAGNSNVQLFQSGRLLNQGNILLGYFRAPLLDINKLVPPDMFGTLTINYQGPSRAIGENLRIREINGRVDFAMPTLVR